MADSIFLKIAFIRRLKEYSGIIPKMFGWAKQLSTREREGKHFISGTTKSFLKHLELLKLWVYSEWPVANIRRAQPVLKGFKQVSTCSRRLPEQIFSGLDKFSMFQTIICESLNRFSKSETMIFASLNKSWQVSTCFRQLCEQIFAGLDNFRIFQTIICASLSKSWQVSACFKSC